MNHQELWEQFTKERNISAETYVAWAFPYRTGALAELVWKGVKTAFAQPYPLYEVKRKPLPQAGNYSVILDENEEALCIVQTIKVSVLPFEQVSTEHARNEGEGDGSIAYWKMVHEQLFQKEMKDYGLTFSEKTDVVCEEFEVVYRKGEDEAYKKEKDRLRRYAGTTSISDRRNEIGYRMYERIQTMPQWQNAKTIGLFYGTATEPDTTYMMQQAWSQGKTVCLPYCISMKDMEYAPIASMDELQVGLFGIPEPKNRPECAPDVDLWIIPCVMADKKGYRLGHGMGFYDRFLHKTSKPKIILCPECYLVDSILHEPWDIRCDAVVSETDIYWM
ncbi:MAG: 5-formyltetrahydrofolate cyclo-ligase [Erysipelotrichaceae bacterium]|nr:5-formyltetrahydrofolate cyclo-ligase [Erysipelotrichaceae bacterium]